VPAPIDERSTIGGSPSSTNPVVLPCARGVLFRPRARAREEHTVIRWISTRSTLVAQSKTTHLTRAAAGARAERRSEEEVGAMKRGKEVVGCAWTPTAREASICPVKEEEGPGARALLGGSAFSCACVRRMGLESARARFLCGRRWAASKAAVEGGRRLLILVFFPRLLFTPRAPHTRPTHTRINILVGSAPPARCFPPSKNSRGRKTDETLPASPSLLPRPRTRTQTRARTLTHD
jgi:hypothetical protein